MPPLEPGLHAALRDFLVSAFSASELRRLARDIPHARDLSAELPDGGSLVSLADALVDLARARSVLPGLLDACAAVRERRIDEIEALRRWLTRPPQKSPARAPEATPAPIAPAPSAPPTIGILTALPKELAAVRTMLDTNERRQVAGSGAGRDYFVGTLPAAGGGVHTVAVALLTDMGNQSAAVHATLLLSHFPSVRHLILCGIAGGVPRPGEPEHDVRLGDVVVSNRNGVIQYDLVKIHADGEREHRHPPRPPGAELLNAVRYLQAEEELGERPWEREIPRGRPMRSSARPADNSDAKGAPLVLPDDPERRPGQPRVFHAPIAAANALLKDARLRDELGRRFGVKAIEMEGSGVADAAWIDGAGYLVVRGVCDYCDAAKGDAWQGAAAVAAAAYVRALLGSMAAG